MSVLVVIEHPRNWDLKIPGVEVVSAREYLTDPRYSDSRRARVYNFCRRYGYQSVGYYVSLLAEARGHKPMPSVSTVQDLRMAPLVRIVSEDLDDLLQRSLQGLKGPRFSLSVYFGRNLARRYDRLSKALFNYFPVPFLRFEFERTDRWRMESVQPVASSEIPPTHRPFVNEQARRYFEKPREGAPRGREYRYEMAILVNPEETHRPSNDGALKRMARAARAMGINAALIDKDDYGRLGEYDALFIRETTRVDHYTYRFARKAEAEGLVVIDDPVSIVRCSNKVYLAEVFARNRIPHPQTLILHPDNAGDAAWMLGFPVVLKRPDSSFSRGVVKARDRADLDRLLAEMFEESDLVIAQEYIESGFDWRIGVLEGRALFACKYFMAPGHWQIETTRSDGRVYGKVETLPLEEVPTGLVRLAERCAHLVGNGLYGLDIKETGGRFLVMEINDNPNIDHGFEDKALGDELYRILMRTFLDRLENRGVRGFGP
ncbi:MAG: RimK family protein [Planctomycetaceae bacterium]|nr:RimK family protein [Planctomycetota bacterium]NUN51712.1 RimK family protein [Planctomycetaceae bacterium]